MFRLSSKVYEAVFALKKEEVFKKKEKEFIKNVFLLIIPSHAI